MSNMFKISLFAVICFGFISCAPENRPIPQGLYESQNGLERITVTEREFDFDLVFYYGLGMVGKRLVGSYDYSVNDDGSIYLLLRSDRNVAELAGYDWFWKNGSILRVNRRADSEPGEETWFLKKAMKANSRLRDT